MTAAVAPNDAPLHSAFRAVVENRRSVYFYTDKPVPEAAIKRALRLSLLAPNHHRTRPWRFFVFCGAARAQLGAAYGAAARRLERDVDRARQRAFDAPVMILVGCVPAIDRPNVKLHEEEFATAAAVENLMLSLASEAIGSLLRTGEVVESDEVRDTVGLTDAHARVMAVVNVGYRDTQRPLAARPEPDIGAFVRWMSA